MTGEELWTALRESGASNAELKSLGYDLYFARSAPKGDAVPAIMKMAVRLTMQPKFVYAALNIDPGRKVLEKLAEDYREKRAWANVAESTKGYVERVSHRMTIILNAQKKTPVAPTPNEQEKTEPSLTSKVSTAVVAALLVTGAILYSAAARHHRSTENISRSERT